MSRIYLSPPHMGPDERQLLLDAFDSNWIAPLGPHVTEFEKEFSAAVDVPHAVALSSGTAALHLGLTILGVCPGDEVLVSTLTFAATANAVVYMGARPVFIDSSATTWNIEPELVGEELEAAQRRRRLPKAVIAVDLYGQPCDYEGLRRVCEPFGVPVLQDAAEALGADYRGKPVGGQGLMAAFSFNGNKIITTSSGGMLVSNRADYVEKARFLSTQARDPAPHYEHSQIGFNYRMSNLLAAVGRGQLRVLRDRVRRRRAIFDRYRKALGDLAGLTFMPEAAYGRCTRWLTCLTVDPVRAGVTRDDLRLELEKWNIESRPVWKPMHLQPAYKACRVVGGDVSQALFDNGLCLPSGSSLSDSSVDRIVQLVRERIRNGAAAK